MKIECKLCNDLLLFDEWKPRDSFDDKFLLFKRELLSINGLDIDMFYKNYESVSKLSVYYTDEHFPILYFTLDYYYLHCSYEEEYCIFLEQVYPETINGAHYMPNSNVEECKQECDYFIKIISDSK